MYWFLKMKKVLGFDGIGVVSKRVWLVDLRAIEKLNGDVVKREKVRSENG